MDLYAVVREALSSGGALPKVSLVALAWTLAAGVGHLSESAFALARFSREGPVMPPLLPQLELKWSAAGFRLALWRWFRRVGLIVQFGTVVWALALSGHIALQVLRAGLVTRGWNEELASALKMSLGTTVLFAGGILATLVFGGLAGLLSARASNYVRASNALLTREDVERVRRMLERLERDSDVPPPGARELGSPAPLATEAPAAAGSEDWPE
ncbi:MAG: hypothetical protein FJ109_07370 [Deltaproteobacteria bacterium]|nr:hypothetical protein [Deltaproteobacteria bacterium]